MQLTGRVNEKENKNFLSHQLRSHVFLPQISMVFILFERKEVKCLDDPRLLGIKGSKLPQLGGPGTLILRRETLGLYCVPSQIQGTACPMGYACSCTLYFEPSPALPSAQRPTPTHKKVIPEVSRKAILD